MPKIRFLLVIFMTACLSCPAYSQQSTGSSAGNVGRLRNGLPPVSMDSFVFEAKEHREDIYGDEGTTELPPLNDFDYTHRINIGIMDRRDKGLTTGHGSNLPNAWGYDEFIMPPGEWSQSGSNGNQSNPAATPDYYQFSGSSNQNGMPDYYQFAGQNSNPGSPPGVGLAVPTNSAMRTTQSGPAPGNGARSGAGMFASSTGQSGF